MDLVQANRAVSYPSTRTTTMGLAPMAEMTPSRPRTADDEPKGSITYAGSTLKPPRSQTPANPRLALHPSLVHTPSRLSLTATNLISRLDKNEIIGHSDMDYLLNLFKDDFQREGTGLRPATFFNVSMPAFVQDRDAPNRFIAPIYHSPGHWSIVHVSHVRVRKQIQVRHYDPTFHEGRNTDVRKIVRIWAGKSVPHLEVKYELESGPQVLPKSGDSAVHVVMAARIFSRNRKIGHDLTKNWDKPDPKLFLKQTLRNEYHEERGSPGNPLPVSSGEDSSDDDASRTSTLPTPADTPTPNGQVKKKTVLSKTAQENKATPGKEGKYHRTVGIFVETSVNDDQRQTMPASTASPSIPSVATPSGKRATTGSVPDERSEPNSKRRRTCMDQPLSFSVEETMEEYKSFSESLALPSVGDLYQERAKRKQTFDEEGRKLKSKKQRLEEDSQEYAERCKAVNDHNQEYDVLKGEITADEEKFAGLSLPEMNTLSGDALRAMLQNLKAAFQNSMAPVKASLKDKLEKKRKAERLLKSAEMVCSTLKTDIYKAETARNEAEAALKDSCQREEMAALMSEYDRKLQAIQKESERKDWYEAFCERRNAP
ncbi:hypothetical protein FSARC_10656 [Fusarium sarcochroum]|uniref:Ubiquitin-like protease family profile domain-containing protein n=1 Tax=Fusarium sarcochroum TaxID=1208366 RepID=A0A8H4TKZ1_9HYPO|nr:hypothetical protein FSARC_10656 [Fusarium sarcochroum]